jgi:hypothetical protein
MIAAKNDIRRFSAMAAFCNFHRLDQSNNNAITHNIAAQSRAQKKIVF